MGRESSDEAYVLELCDEVLGEAGQHQARFDWLRGDAGKDGRSRALPVHSYWPRHCVVVEYREIQHDRPVPHFDKPDRLTVSGVHRGVQRALYDRRRDEQIPAHGLRLVVIKPAIWVWDSTYRQRGVRFEIPADRQDASDPGLGLFFLDRPHRPITVVWSS